VRVSITLTARCTATHFVNRIYAKQIDEMPDRATPHSRRIAGFDGLRGLAVLLVFIDHRLPGADAHYLGGYAVHIFFVLSGFLIIGMLHRDQLAIAEHKISAFQAWREFMLRRAARIFPIYYLILAIMLALSLSGLGSHRDAQDLAFSGLFLTNEYIVAHHHWGAFNQAWTLAIEEQFYLLAAPLLLLAARPKVTRSICMATALIGAVWNVWLCLSFPRSMAPGLDSLSNFTYIAIGGMFAPRPYS
jgi:peptidoglycan/LPS O-acetylase OafA/YrhL